MDRRIECTEASATLDEAFFLAGPNENDRENRCAGASLRP